MTAEEAISPQAGVPQPDAVADLPMWVQAIGQPIGATGGGEDPRYGDNFGAIKSEIDKLGGNDYEHVASLSKQLLAEEAKDLRVASYLVLANLYLAGFKGMCEALVAYRVILERYWDACFPQKENARLQAVTWLKNERMSAFLQKQNAEALSLAELEAMRETVNGFNRIVCLRFGNDGPRWDSLSQLFDRLVATRKEAAARLALEQQEQETRLRQGAAEEGPLSEERAQNMIARVARYCRDKGERGRAIAVLRGYRWGSLAIPPNDNGRTRIPPFRATAFDEIKALEAGGAPGEEVFALCEELLLEPGAQWNLDLQAIVHRTLGALGDVSAQQVLESEVVGLLKRCPMMTELSYDGGEPFAGAGAQEWLETLSGDEESGGAGVAGPDDEAMRQIIRRAEQAANGKNAKSAMIAGLGVLRELSAGTGRERFIHRLEQARLCVRTRHSEMALPILSALEREMACLDVAEWEPGLALQLWRIHIQALQQEIPRASGPRKAMLEEQADEINAAVCTTNLEEAVRMKRAAKPKGVKANGG